jgi:hypothetical protein
LYSVSKNEIMLFQDDNTRLSDYIGDDS